MAIALAFRVAIVLAPAAVRVVKWAEGPGVSTASNLGQALWDRLADPDETDEDLEAAVSAQTGSMADVATYEDPFSLRKLQVLWSRDGGIAGGTDNAVTTHHFVKLVAGAPSDLWVAADFIAVEGAFTTYWNALKPYYTARQGLKQYRWYKAGPQATPPQPPVRIVDVNTVGNLAAANGQQPPQVAMSVTEKTTDATAWGRFYLPATGDTQSDGYGRIGAVLQAVVADQADVMYEAWVTNLTPAVVYSIAKPERETGSGETLPARPARALTVTQVQVDDLWDVIRSRRWKQPNLRLQRDVAGA